MKEYIYHGILNVEGRHIDATWTTGFNTIWIDNNTFNGYRELINYLHKK
jgi:hypothetical protein